MTRYLSWILLLGMIFAVEVKSKKKTKFTITGIVLNKDGEGLFGVSFKIKGLPDELNTSVNPVKTLTPRFITRALEAAKRKQNSK